MNKLGDIKRSFARIGKVTLKGGGEVHILKPREKTELQKRCISDMVYITEDFEDMDGYLMVVWDAQGFTSSAFKNNGGFSPNAIPGLVTRTTINQLRNINLID